MGNWGYFTPFVTVLFWGPALLSPNNFCSRIFESPRNGGNSPAVPRWSLCVTKDIKNANCNNPMQFQGVQFEQSWWLKTKMIQRKTPLSCSPLGCFPNIQPAPKNRQQKSSSCSPELCLQGCCFSTTFGSKDEGFVIASLEDVHTDLGIPSSKSEKVVENGWKTPGVPRSDCCRKKT